MVAILDFILFMSASEKLYLQTKINRLYWVQEKLHISEIKEVVLDVTPSAIWLAA